MQKDVLLQELATKLSTGEIQPREVMQCLKRVPNTRTAGSEETFSHSSVAKTLFIVGAAVVVIGILFFVSQIWSDIGALGRIAVTLGLGLVLTAMGSMLLQSDPRQHGTGTVFHWIGGVLIPSGAVVTLTELSVGEPSLWPLAITFVVLAIFYFLLHIAHKTATLTFFCIANATMSLYLAAAAVMDGSTVRQEDIYAYLTMVVGVSYLLLAFAFRKRWNERLTDFLHLAGSGGFFVAAFSQVFDSPPWQLLYFLLLIGGLFVSVFLRSRSILFTSTVFLIVHVSYITSQYFADSIGWPVSLVLLGFLFIGLGHASLTINRKYIAVS